MQNNITVEAQKIINILLDQIKQLSLNNAILEVRLSDLEKQNEVK